MKRGVGLWVRVLPLVHVSGVAIKNGGNMQSRWLLTARFTIHKRDI